MLVPRASNAWHRVPGLSGHAPLVFGTRDADCAAEAGHPGTTIAAGAAYANFRQTNGDRTQLIRFCAAYRAPFLPGLGDTIILYFPCPEARSRFNRHRPSDCSYRTPPSSALCWDSDAQFGLGWADRGGCIVRSTLRFSPPLSGMRWFPCRFRAGHTTGHISGQVADQGGTLRSIGDSDGPDELQPHCRHPGRPGRRLRQRTLGTWP